MLTLSGGFGSSDEAQIRDALRKQIPTQPNRTCTGATVCPCCNRFLERHERKHGNIDIPFCKWCGQAIDWN